jgi:hypothetical protein
MKNVSRTIQNGWSESLWSKMQNGQIPKWTRYGLQAQGSWLTPRHLSRRLSHAPVGCLRSVKLLFSLFLPLGIGVLGYCTTVSGQQSPQSAAVRIAVRVLDPETNEAKKLPRARDFHAGNPVIHLILQDKSTTLSVLANSYLIVHAKKRTRFSIDNPDVIESPALTYAFPSDVQGIFQAKKPGSAVLTIHYASPAEVCGVVAGCSPNWAGYVLSQRAPFTGVTAQWQVPTITSNSPPGMSCTWVGIDGDGNNTVLQAGTEQDFNPWYAPFSGAIYYAWFESFPSPQSFITHVQSFFGVFAQAATSNEIVPGDVIQVSISPAPGSPTPVPGNAGQWQIQFSDQTQNWSFSTNVTYTGGLASSEWIEEATSGPSGVQTLADYDQVQFNFENRVATGGGPLASPNFTSSEEVSMNEAGTFGIYSTPSNPSSDGDGFFLTYTEGQAHQAYPPGPWIDTTTLPPATLNKAYSQMLDAFEESFNPQGPMWSWALVSGALPVGLSLNSSTGAISGTPTAPGASTFSVVATDMVTGASSQSQSLSISVSAVPIGVLQVWCGAAVLAKVDGKSVACDSYLSFSVGSHTVSGVATGPPGEKLSFSGDCNSKGRLVLSAGQIDTCTISSVFPNTCTLGEIWNQTLQKCVSWSNPCNGCRQP